MRPDEWDLLSNFLKYNCDQVWSIFLIGSHALEEEEPQSDIDLIVVTQGEEGAEKIRKAMQKVNKRYAKPLFDCKIYTQQDFRAAKSGNEHLYLWTALTNGKRLCGENISDMVRIQPSIVVDIIWKSLKELETALSMLESHIQFTGCCYAIYNALTTSYFTLRFVLKRTDYSCSKKGFLSRTLEDRYEVVVERYDWIAAHIKRHGSTGEIKIPITADSRFGKRDYKALLPKCKITKQLLSKVFDWASAWADQ